MTRRAVLYARVSTVRQVESDLSIPDQLRAGRAYCQQRNWPIVAEYIDAGASATDDNRPEFQRMVDDAIRDVPGFEVIVVHSFSRYFRDNFQAEFYRRRLQKAGVEVVSITQEFGEGPTADLMRQFIGLMDEYQSKENGKHSLRGMEENARQGFLNHKPPFGYRAVVAETRGAKAKKRLEIEPHEAEIVRVIFSLARVGLTGADPMGVRAVVQIKRLVPGLEASS
jgi:DNA invertase Pin-like site-specific DNA recombinase